MILHRYNIIIRNALHCSVSRDNAYIADVNINDNCDNLKLKTAFLWVLYKVIKNITYDKLYLVNLMYDGERMCIIYVLIRFFAVSIILNPDHKLIFEEKTSEVGFRW